MIDTDPLSLMRYRARWVWAIGGAMFIGLVGGLGVAFWTGWIYQAVGRFMILPTGCFVFLAWLGFGSRWALSAAPISDRRLLGSVGSIRGFTKKVLLINVAVVLAVSFAWAVVEGSLRPLGGFALLLILGVLLLLGLWAPFIGGYLGILYSRATPATHRSSESR